MTPELQQQYDALVLAANGTRDDRWDAETFIRLWNALPEGLRRYIDFQLAADNLLASYCRELFIAGHGRPPAALRYFEKWEDRQELWPSRTDDDTRKDKTRLVSQAEIQEQAAADRAALIRGGR